MIPPRGAIVVGDAPPNRDVTREHHRVSCHRDLALEEAVHDNKCATRDMVYVCNRAFHTRDVSFQPPFGFTRHIHAGLHITQFEFHGWRLKGRGCTFFVVDVVGMSQLSYSEL